VFFCGCFNLSHLLVFPTTDEVVRTGRSAVSAPTECTRRPRLAVSPSSASWDGTALKGSARIVCKWQGKGARSTPRFWPVCSTGPGSAFLDCFLAGPHLPIPWQRALPSPARRRQRGGPSTSTSQFQLREDVEQTRLGPGPEWLAASSAVPGMEPRRPVLSETRRNDVRADKSKTQTRCSSAMASRGTGLPPRAACGLLRPVATC
jgi:hypothetical protein